MSVTYPLPRVVALHDLSGFGRASLTLVIPILATMGVQVCPLPTAVLSSQTSGMQGFSFCDLTEQMRAFLDHWRCLGLSFDCVYSGFLGSPLQIELAMECLHDFLKPKGLALIDPVLGDNGKLDPTQTTEMVLAQRKLVSFAKVITPNLTEASFLLGVPYVEHLPEAELKAELMALAELGPEWVVITSAPASSKSLCAVVAYDREQGRFWRVENKRFPVFYPGTGDAFASALLGSLLNGESLPMALVRAVSFISHALMVTYGYGIPTTDGVLLEKSLPLLSQTKLNLCYEEF